MDVDAINTLTEEEKAELIKANACFYCTKPGHQANDCRKRKADRQRSSQGTTSRPDNQVRTTETSNPPDRKAASTAPDMMTKEIAAFLKENMGTLDEDTKLGLIDSLMPSDFIEARN